MAVNTNYESFLEIQSDLAEKSALKEWGNKKGFWKKCENGDFYMCDEAQIIFNTHFQNINNNCAKYYWDLLGDIPVNQDDEIEIGFLDFEIGTDKFTIWHWFEETFNLSVANDLMFIS